MLRQRNIHECQWWFADEDVLGSFRDAHYLRHRTAYIVQPDFLPDGVLVRPIFFANSSLTIATRGCGLTAVKAQRQTMGVFDRRNSAHPPCY